MQLEKESREYDLLLTYPSDKLKLFESMIPLGLASVAAVAEQAGYSAKIIDFNHYHGDFRKDLRKWKPKIIGIGGTTPTRKGSFLTARLAKEVLPDMPVVYGGVHASFTAADTLANIPQIDYVIKGEGELSFVALCDIVIRGGAISPDSIDGLSRRENGSIVENRHSRINDLGALPLPARHLFEYDYPMRLDFMDIPADVIMTSRGCPAACSFCSASRMFPGGVRTRPISHIRKEIEAILARKSIGGLKIFDSTFTAVRDHVIAFCEMIEPYNLLWECEIRSDTVDYDLLALMKQAGCCAINIGLETTSARLIKSIAKKIEVSQVESVLAWCRQLAIKTKVFFTFGHLGESYEECLRDLAYMREHSGEIDFFATTVGMRVYPGTRLESDSRKKGLIPEDFSWARFSPPKKNLLVLEPGDILVLDQKHLPLLKLLLVLIKLFTQKTLLLRSFVLKMSVNNFITFLFRVGKEFLYTSHVIRRHIKRMTEASGTE